MTANLIVAPDAAAAAADHLLALRPRTIALAGGSTPHALYERLATAPFPWAGTDLFFGDERCVALDHPDSNYGMARATLFAKLGPDARARVHPMPGPTCDDEGYERLLHQRFGPGLPVFDFVLLGLGADGHTASLFPHDPALDERSRLVVRVQRPDHPRLTLTLPVLSAAGNALFLVAGAGKRHALARLLAADDIPAARVTAQSITIIADQDAAP